MPILHPAAAADRENGERIAERWCAQCHVVASGQKRGSDEIPTFAEIGRSDRFDKESLAAFLAAPHGSRMQNLSLTRSEIADLVAYINSARH
jgi:cytochrome c2